MICKLKKTLWEGQERQYLPSLHTPVKEIVIDETYFPYDLLFEDKDIVIFARHRIGLKKNLSVNDY